ncbi:hypothetical protein QBE52_13740 [Clostridiaceae bacterium 35-E11]
MCLSTQTWNKMSLSQQEAIVAAAKAIEAKRFSGAQVQEKEYEDMLADAGVEIIEFIDEELANFANTIRQKVWPITKSDFNEEFFNGIVEKYNFLE